MRLAVAQGDRHPASLVGGIHLKKARIGRQRIQALDGPAAQLVAPDAAQDRGMIAELPSHHGEVGRSAAEPHPLWQHVPKQLANSQNQMWFLQTLPPANA